LVVRFGKHVGVCSAVVEFGETDRERLRLIVRDYVMADMQEDETVIPTFTPQLTKQEALALAAMHPSDDPEARKAGETIRHGDYSFDNLRTIFEWKTKNRGKSRLNKNSMSEVEEALRLAAMAKEPRSAIAVLKELSGVNVPVASAIMTLVHPEKYTVLDFRALEALGDQSSRRSVTFYLHYLRYCTDLAKKWGMSYQLRLITSLLADMATSGKACCRGSCLVAGRG
jgi:hypothetical protein